MGKRPKTWLVCFKLIASLHFRSTPSIGHKWPCWSHDQTHKDATSNHQRQTQTAARMGPTFLFESRAVGTNGWSSLVGLSTRRRVPASQTSASEWDSVDDEWKDFMSLLSNVFHKATRHDATHIIEPTHEHELLRKLNQLGVRNGEGINIPAVQQVNRALPSAIPSNSTQNDKALAKKLARRYKWIDLLKRTFVGGSRRAYVGYVG